MAPTARTLSTPVKQTPPPAVTESPGNWKHPRLTEITLRQSRTVFSEKNLRQIVYNALGLALVLLIRTFFIPHISGTPLGPLFSKYGNWLYLTLILLPLANIGLALLPLLRPADDLSDIPLTPAQRKLLGLPPSSRPPTPNSTYSTPPRYSRTPSQVGSPASIKSYASSPLSNRGSPAIASDMKTSGTSPYGNSPYVSGSPSAGLAASPLLHKAVAAGAAAAVANNAARRSSFGSPSPLGASTASSLFDGPATPSPSGPSGKRSSVSLNNKWLYEKGRRTSSRNI
ncbi:nuclear pore complex component-domain-containing protein [Lasiosphaeria ovina]|uniref:Nuclear pore complex component-domain-containing protein n=1 Tax=Lasiosphaeria ovina TaxID=92902 RepID=A0AAE0N8K1_9PEZI|nr:nuclear pore complex component-domain-containing protein [Lasiosphaeria ovina]